MNYGISFSKFQRREPEDKSLIEETTICIIILLSDFQNKSVTREVIDSLSKPCEPKRVKSRVKATENSEEKLIGRVKEQLNADGYFRPITSVPKLFNSLKKEQKTIKRTSGRRKNEMNDFASLSISDRKQRFEKELIPKNGNFPIAIFANSVIPLDLANVN